MKKKTPIKKVKVQATSFDPLEELLARLSALKTSLYQELIAKFDERFLSIEKRFSALENLTSTTPKED